MHIFKTFYMTLWQLLVAQLVVPALFFGIAFAVAGSNLSDAAREVTFLVMMGLQALLLLVVFARSLHLFILWFKHRSFSLKEFGFIMLSALLTIGTWFATLITGLLLVGFS